MVINGKRIEGLPGKTMLEVFEANDINVETHCREGFCGACRKTKVSGDAKYLVEPIASFDANSEVITCCASSDSDVVLLA